MRYPTRAVKATPPYDVSSFSPPGVSLASNMMQARFHRGPGAMTYEWFYQKVRLNGVWDYKNYAGRQYANFGNFNYGATGTAAGIPGSVLLRAAGWAQTRAGSSKPEFGSWHSRPPFGDDPEDQAWIRAGIDYAKRAGF